MNNSTSNTTPQAHKSKDRVGLQERLRKRQDEPRQHAATSKRLPDRQRDERTKSIPTEPAPSRKSGRNNKGKSQIESRNLNDHRKDPAHIDVCLGKLSEFIKEPDPRLGPCVAVYVSTQLLRITAAGDDAILLAQLLWWFERSKGKIRCNAWTKWPRKDGTTERRRGVAKTHGEWSEDLGIPQPRIRQAIKRLVKAGLVRKKVGSYQAKKRTFLRPSLKGIRKQLKAIT